MPTGLEVLRKAGGWNRVVVAVSSCRLPTTRQIQAQANLRPTRKVQIRPSLSFGRKPSIRRADLERRWCEGDRRAVATRWASECGTEAGLRSRHSPTRSRRTVTGRRGPFEHARPHLRSMARERTDVSCRLETYGVNGQDLQDCSMISKGYLKRHRRGIEALVPRSVLEFNP